MTPEYDAIIIGAGPAGLTAGMYLARAGKKTLCLEQGVVGGQIATTSHLENYPGFPKGISGRELMALFEGQAVGFGLELMPGRVEELKVDGKLKTVTAGGFPFTAAVVVVATGIVQKLGVPGEEEYLGRGVSYCATCDGALYRGSEVALIGSNDWAVEEALFLTKFVSSLHMLIKPQALKPTDPNREELLRHPSLKVVGTAAPLEITGDGRNVTGLRALVGGEERTFKVDGVFIFTGKKSPGTKFLRGLAELTPGGFVITGTNCASSVPGIFAAGDVRREKFHQVATAVGDGAVAGMEAVRYLNEDR